MTSLDTKSSNSTSTPKMTPVSNFTVNHLRSLVVYYFFSPFTDKFLNHNAFRNSIKQKLEMNVSV